MLKARDLVEARLYKSEEDVLQEPLRHCYAPALSCAFNSRFITTRSRDSPWQKPASLAGVSWAQMKDILLEHGVQPRLGPETLEEAEMEAQTLRDYLQT